MTSTLSAISQKFVNKGLFMASTSKSVSEASDKLCCIGMNAQHEMQIYKEL